MSNPKKPDRKKLAIELIRLSGEAQDVALQMQRFKNCTDMAAHSKQLLGASILMSRWAKAILLK